MPNVATLLKSEISRLSRREIRKEVLPLRKAAATHRREIAALKRRAQTLEQALKRLSMVHAKPASAVPVEQDAGKFRFSAKGLASQRQRLGLSVEQCGRLLGASAQSVYNWEQGKTRPLARHIPAIAALRTMGKRDVAARLEALQR